MTRIGEDILKAPVQGLALRGDRFRHQLADGPTLVVFLQPFSSPFSRELIHDIRHFAARNADFPPVLFIFQGTPEQGEGFFARHWPGAHSVADAPCHFYQKFGFQRARRRLVYGLRAAFASFRAALKGHLTNLPNDAGHFGGWVVLLHGDQILWRFDPRFPGDLPQWRRVYNVLRVAIRFRQENTPDWRLDARDSLLT